MKKIINFLINLNRALTSTRLIRVFLTINYLIILIVNFA